MGVKSEGREGATESRGDISFKPATSVCGVCATSVCGLDDGAREVEEEPAAEPAGDEEQLRAAKDHAAAHVLVRGLEQLQVLPPHALRRHRLPHVEQVRNALGTTHRETGFKGGEDHVENETKNEQARKNNKQNTELTAYRVAAAAVVEGLAAAAPAEQLDEDEGTNNQQQNGREAMWGA